MISFDDIRFQWEENMLKPNEHKLVIYVHNIPKITKINKDFLQIDLIKNIKDTFENYPE